jgi:Kdo2-lipid IVA lauroyltransferase/acyltransferase
MRPKGSVKHLLEWVIILPCFRLFQWLPETWSLLLARTVGRAAYYLCRHERAWCCRNIAAVYGETLSPAEQARLAPLVFENIAETFVEILRMDGRWLEERVEFIGIEHAREALRQAGGKGFIGVGGHLGNWEIISGLGRIYGIESTMLARPMDNPYVERELARCRARYRNSTLPRTTSHLAEATRRLRSGAALGIAIDLNVVGQGVVVDFMGIPAMAARGAAKIARMEDVPVLLTIPLRIGQGRFRFILEPVPMQKSADIEHDLQVNTQRMTDQFTAWVHRYPEQWQWQHARWRTRPDGSEWSLFTQIGEMRKTRKFIGERPALPWVRSKNGLADQRAA